MTLRKTIIFTTTSVALRRTSDWNQVLLWN